MKNDWTVKRISTMLEVLNIKYFDGKLDINFPIIIEHDLNKINDCAEVSVYHQKAQVEFFRINSFWLDNKILTALLVHELIHVYQVQVLGLNCTEILEQGNQGHGVSFMDKARKIKELHNIDTYDTLYTLTMFEMTKFLDTFKGF